ncbi:MAG: DUF58 domain-containing protein [Planctomycetota bacterium]
MVELQSPFVAFAPGFMRRVEQFVPRLAAARERREGAGGARLDGAGLEFVGRRPYRPGDDPRRIDWELLAREDRPWVRVLHREAAERWAIAVDVSGSMGVGPPGKLQAAAEVALALAAVGVRARALVTLHLSDGPEGSAPPNVALRRSGDLARAAEVLGRAVARPSARGLGAVIRDRRLPSDAGRVVLLGDLWDVSAAEVASLQRPGRELVVGRVLAPVELEPGQLGASAARFIDPEDGRSALVALDAHQVAAYQEDLDAELDRFVGALARRRIRVHAWRSDAPFEDPAGALLDPR